MKKRIVSKKTGEKKETKAARGSGLGKVKVSED